MAKKEEKAGLFGSIFSDSDFGNFASDDLSPPIGIRDDSLRSSSGGKALFLNRYSLDDMIKILKKTGLIKHLALNVTRNQYSKFSEINSKLIILKFSTRKMIRQIS